MFYLTKDINKVFRYTLFSIYINGCADCNQVYIGQMKPRNEIQKEHIANYCYGTLESSSVTKHINDTGHNINFSKVELIKNVN